MSRPPDQVAFDAMNSAFRSGKIFDAKAEDLTRYICALGSLDPNNQDHKTTSIIRALAINHIQMAGIIRDLNTQNGVTAIKVKTLTAFCMILAALQVAAAVFFIWRDFNPRNVSVDKERIGENGRHDTHLDKDESPNIPKPIRE